MGSHGLYVSHIAGTGQVQASRREEGMTMDTNMSNAPDEILVVVDMQVDFVNGTLGTPEAQAIVGDVCHAIDGWEGDIAVTLDTHEPDYMDTQEGRNLPVTHCQEGTEGWMLVPQVTEALRRYEERTGKKLVFYKKGTFGSKELAQDMANLNEIHPVRRIRLIGLCTDICVVSNALLLKAFLPEVPIEVEADCCAGVTPDTHEAALATMACCQVNIIR